MLNELVCLLFNFCLVYNEPVCIVDPDFQYEMNLFDFSSMPEKPV